jgi:hypothetical protein
VYHPLTVERVKEIAEMNKDGKKPLDLGAKDPSNKSVNICFIYVQFCRFKGI